MPRNSHRQYSVTASYPGDGNYTASNSTTLVLNLAADFTVADRGITSQTVAAGRTASYINDIGVNPFFGFTGTVTVSCTVPAKATTCSVNPNSYPLGSGKGIGTLSVTTTARTVAPVAGITSSFVPSIWLTSTIGLFGAMLVPFARSRQRRNGRYLLLSLLFLLSLITIGWRMRRRRK